MTIIKPKKKKRKERKLLDHTTIIVKFFIRKNIIMKFTSLGTTYFQKLIYIYIYIYIKPKLLKLLQFSISAQY